MFRQNTEYSQIEPSRVWCRSVARESMVWRSGIRSSVIVWFGW